MEGTNNIRTQLLSFLNFNSQEEQYSVAVGIFSKLVEIV